MGCEGRKQSYAGRPVTHMSLPPATLVQMHPELLTAPGGGWVVVSPITVTTHQY